MRAVYARCEQKGAMGEDDVKQQSPKAQPVRLNYGRPIPRQTKDRGRSALTVISAASAATVICFSIEEIYGSMSGGEMFIFGMVPVALCSLVALIFSIIMAPKSKRALCSLAILCLLPAIVIAARWITQDIEFRINGPSDRFRDHLAKAIPASVGRLAFVPYEERQGETALMLRFNIAPADLERLISDDGFVRVQPGNLHNVNDTFNDPAYLKIGNADEFYQRAAGHDEVDTLRVNKEHTAVVFRNEFDVRDQKTSVSSVAAPLQPGTPPIRKPKPSVLPPPGAGSTP
jgi:hypothetical protein